MNNSIIIVIINIINIWSNRKINSQNNKYDINLDNSNLQNQILTEILIFK